MKAGVGAISSTGSRLWRKVFQTIEIIGGKRSDPVHVSAR
jgi:hypothetical protein